MRKTRPDDVLGNLPADVQDQIYELRAFSLRELVVKVRDEFAVETSIASLSNWLRKIHARKCAEARASAVAFADTVEADAGKVDAAVAAQLGQLAFDAAMTKDVALMRTAYSLLLDRQRLANDTASVALMRAKFEDQVRRNAEARQSLAAVVSKGGLTPATVAEIEAAAKLL